ncbi:diguanylate cyclase domain-containing protein [Trichocoleus sp. FACHB-262]|uniref:diguanylate cyclase domain-containing protein n=1 Tax=Trichocoleus sp. FACHB-262 TaxID=2692869 RepID=UPI0016882AF2|nr:diguanylate cyclase [Trichocoleus sp. FACHB-262]MBD2123377.1 diguanylate cyclase [Trichocoleus sp. FACHB-262]
MFFPSALWLSSAIAHDHLSVSPDLPMTEVVKLMSQAHKSYVLVVDADQLVGIFTERDVVRLTAAKTSWLEVAIATVMTTPVITLQESDATDVLVLLSRLWRHRIRHLPILDQRERIIGVVTRQSIREALKPAALLKARQIHEVMVSPVVAAPITTSVLQLSQLMHQHQISCVVLVQPEATNPAIAKPIGILTERDVVRLQAQNLDLAQTSVVAVINRPLHAIQPQASLWSAHEQMQQHQIRRLVVVGEAGELLGLVTQSSILQSLDPLELHPTLDALQQEVEARTQEMQQTNEQLQREIVERVKVEQTLQSQIAKEQLMSAIANHMRQSLHLDTILNTTVEEVRQFLQVDRVLIYRFESNGNSTVAVESVATDRMSIVGKVMEAAYFTKRCRQSYQMGQMQAIADVTQANLPSRYLHLLALLQARAALTVPILRGDELWGLLSAYQCAQPRQWQPLEIELLQQLSTQVGIAIQQAQLYQQLEVANQELRRLANSDGLTELANRRSFDEYLDKEWRRALRHRTPLALIMGDVDFFKRYNDCYGHLRGDRCLQQVAAVLRQTAKRPADLAARYGGEEFAILLPNTEDRGATLVATEIQTRIQTLRIPHAQSSIADYVTLSLGIACLVPRTGIAPTFLIAAADKALYQAKMAGRDRYLIYQESTQG